MNPRAAAAAATILALGGVAIAAHPAIASCVAAPPISTVIAQSPTVFVGTVTATSNAGRLARVHVEDVWRGTGIATEVDVSGSDATDAQSATSVDRHFMSGQQYLFVPYAGSGSAFADNDCTVTRAYDAPTAALRPAGLPPATVPATSGAAAGGHVMAAVAIGLGIAMGAAIVAYLARRRFSRRGSDDAIGRRR